MKIKGDSISRRIRGLVASLRANAASAKLTRDPEELRKLAAFTENCAWHLRDIANSIAAAREKEGK
jgi:hypothetical protein